MDGFTLIEMVLIIIVVAIMGAVIALNLSGLSDIKVSNAVNKVVGDLRYAQQLSITTQSRHGLTINAAQDGYSVHIHTGGAGLCGGEPCIKDPTNLGLDFIVNFDFYQQSQLSGVRFSSPTPFCAGAPSNVIEFDKLGAPTDTAGTVMNCTSTIGFSGSSRTIMIEPNTGSLTY
ncbi:MAG: hypothetical protein HY204_07920 [Nitrospirae bacterium]|nr:hypothetical protein [Nitrospirota bacterium]